ncbi:MAG: FAD-dependent oxidoreductase [Deltaproteobacteria bacterium]|nr:FAD-dependent oxidoreductase [Deltaproteobacteria bacterium]
MKYKKLFEPIKIGNVELKNRIIFPPVSTNFASADGHLTDKFIKHYARRANGGAALIIVENVCIDYPGGKKGAFEPRIDSYDFLSDWEILTKEIHKQGALASLELAHPGYKDRGVDSLSEKEILAISEKYAKAAEIAKDAGFDMVEVQGAHGLLVNQFLSPLTNHRDDRWGKPIEFAVKVRKRIAERCGWDLPVTIRLAVEDLSQGGIGITEGKALALSLSSGAYNMIQADFGLGPKEKRLEPMAYPEGWRAYLAEAIRPLPVPVAAVGVIRNPETALSILEKQADIVALGRTLIADPDWTNKVKEGKEHLIRKCIGCSECIKARHDEDAAIRCGVNPNVGNEEDIMKAKHKKIVAVVGCGPAGLEATRIAAERGHEVHLFCKEFGGQLNIASVPPGKEKIRWLMEYYRNALQGCGNITAHHGEYAKESIMAIDPDGVIMATGAKPFVPFPIVEGIVYVYDEVLRGTVKFENKIIVVAGGGFVGCETANFLAGNNEITIVEMLNEILPGVETLTRNYLVNELREKGAKVMTKSKLVEIKKGEVVLENTGNGHMEILKCDGIVVATGGKPSIPFAIGDRAHYVVGDAKEVRKIADAVREGYMAAKQL